MRELEMTFGRAMKFWWSLTWRTSVLMLPVLIAMDVMMAWWFTPELPQDMNPEQMMDMMRSMAPAYLLATLLATIPTLIAMVYAVRWTLAARWKDFRIIVVAPESEAP